jgi:single-strand DNA-binding protein
MAYLNRFECIGHLGSDPEVRTVPGGQVANFRVAVTKRWRTNDVPHEKTTWITCVAWKEKAAFAQRYLRKGAHVMVEGELTVREWEDKNGGGKRYATEILVSAVHLLDKKESAHSDPSERTPRGDDARPDLTQNYDDDPLPF